MTAIKKLTKSTRDQITTDWLVSLPSLGVYRAMHLLRRCGPMLVGVCLERDSSGTEYWPTFHTHVLGKGFPVVSLTLAQPLLTERGGGPWWLRVAHHQEYFGKAASCLAKQALLPLEGAITLPLALTAYQDYAHRPTVHYPIDLFEDMVILAAWCGRSDLASAHITTASEEISSWPSAILESIGGVDRWLSRISALSRYDALAMQVEDEISRLGIERIPTAPLELE